MDIIPRLARLFGTKKLGVDTFIPKLGPFSRLVGMALPFRGCQMGLDIESASLTGFSIYGVRVYAYSGCSTSITHIFPKGEIRL